MFNEEVLARLTQIAKNEFTEKTSLTQIWKAFAPILKEAGIKLNAKNVQEWLIANGYILKSIHGKKTAYAPTEKGTACGIMETSFDNNGYITYYCSYPQEASLFIVGKLEEIYEPIRQELERIKTEKAKLSALKKENKAQEKELNALKRSILKIIRQGQAEAYIDDLDQKLQILEAKDPEQAKEFEQENNSLKDIMYQLLFEEEERIEEIQKVLDTTEPFTPTENPISLSMLCSNLNKHYQLENYKLNNLDIAKILLEAELVYYNEDNVLLPTEEGSKYGISKKAGVETKGPKEGQPFVYAVYGSTIQKIILQLLKDNL